MIDPAYPTSWSNGLACLLPLGVRLMQGGWVGAGAVPGQPWRRREDGGGQEQHMGVRSLALLAKRAHLLLTTGS